MAAFMKCYGTRLLGNRFKLFRRCYSIQPPKILWPLRIEKPEIDDDHNYKTWSDIEGELKAGNDNTPPVDIGVQGLKSSLDVKQIRKQMQQNRHNKELEQSSRLLKLEIPLEEVVKDYSLEKGPHHAMTIAQHYGIYDDLFNGAVFLPALDLGVYYEYDEETVTPVHRGNIIDPEEAKSSPLVQYEASDDSLWTLILTNPDGHLTQHNQEYLHWMVGNIPGSAVHEGEVLCSYLQPFPPKGTGFHRHVFVLFKQESRLDYSKYRLSPNCTSLKERTFKMVEFYREHSESLTPMGLCFFQSEHDDTVRNIYHNILNMKEPVFEFKHPVPYRAVQKKFPGKEPFDRYFDRYRDRKDIAEEVLHLKMDMMCPFKGYEKKLKYPLAHYDAREYVPTWLRRRQELIHRRLEQFEDLP